MHKMFLRHLSLNNVYGNLPMGPIFRYLAWPCGFLGMTHTSNTPAVDRFMGPGLVLQYSSSGSTVAILAPAKQKLLHSCTDMQARQDHCKIMHQSK